MPFTDSHPLWSPDGQSIAFTSDRDGENLVYLMDADGKNVTRLSDPPDEECPPSIASSGDIPLAWSPDGSSLAAAHTCSATTKWRIVSRDGAEITDFGSLYYSSYALEWSPDGQRVLFFSEGTGSTGLMTMNADGSNLLIQRTGPGLSSAHWSPDGRQILFVDVDQAHLSQIFVMNADAGAGAGGTGVTQLTENPGAGQICLH